MQDVFSKKIQTKNLKIDSENEVRAEQEARRFGIDVSLIEYNLSLSIEKRLEQHQRALETILELQEAKMHFDREQEENARTKRVTKNIS